MWKLSCVIFTRYHLNGSYKKSCSAKMSNSLRNTFWIAAFPPAGIAASYLAMAGALRGGLVLSPDNLHYCLARGVIAGVVGSMIFLALLGVGLGLTTTTRLLILSAFTIIWFLVFYLYVAAGAAV
jgi:hypothetical protein